MRKRRQRSNWALSARAASHHLTKDQIRFNKTASARKGLLPKKEAKRYVFGHITNVRKGRG